MGTTSTSVNTRSLNAISMIDHILWSDHLNTTVKKYSIIADAIKPDKLLEKKSDINFEYVEGTQCKYYGMVESLWNSGILKDNMKVIDLGCGLCTTLYNLNLQFKNYEIKADFYGIDHNEELLKLVTKHLSQFWVDNELSVGPKDIMECDLSGYDLILTFLPFKELEDIDNMYNKVFKEMKVGSVFHEHVINGAKLVHKLGECRQLILNNANKHNMEEKVLLFGGEKQFLYIKK
jgi:2-polyprenyl-3-methyl-5-hydroxy-6-metoxy-1,4-benzoquinol methylase